MEKRRGGGGGIPADVENDNEDCIILYFHHLCQPPFIRPLSPTYPKPFCNEIVAKLFSPFALVMCLTRCCCCCLFAPNVVVFIGLLAVECAPHGSKKWRVVIRRAEEWNAGYYWVFAEYLLQYLRIMAIFENALYCQPDQR